MSEFKFYQSIARIGLGIEACLEKKLNVPVLILIYSGIDVAGWLASPDPFASDRTFMDWADAYLLKAKALKCTALDLWGARCGLVHTQTPYSRPSKKGRPRIIWPVFGSARVEEVQEFIELTGAAERYVAVHVNDLYEAWRLGVLLFTKELKGDPGKRERVYAKAEKFFSPVIPEVVKSANAELKRNTVPPKK